MALWSYFLVTRHCRAIVWCHHWEDSEIVGGLEVWTSSFDLDMMTRLRIPVQEAVRAREVP